MTLYYSKGIRLYSNLCIPCKNFEPFMIKNSISYLFSSLYKYVFLLQQINFIKSEHALKY
jgi:hypothetical protein